MRAVILAAGTGTRLGRVTADRPKCLIEVGGRPLLAYSLDALNDHGIRDVVLVVGYLHDRIEGTFGSRYRDLTLSYVRNDDYATTGSMFSFSKARATVERDEVLLLESDLLFDPKAVSTTLTAPFANALLAAPISGSGDEVFLCVDADGRLTGLGKELPAEERRRAIGELVGISRFSAPFLEALFGRAEWDYANGQITFHYEETVCAASRAGHPVHVVLCDNLAWIEIDTQKDLDRAHGQIFPRLRQLA